MAQSTPVVDNLMQGFEEGLQADDDEEFGMERPGMEIPWGAPRRRTSRTHGRAPQNLAGVRGLAATPTRFAGDEDVAPPSSIDVLKSEPLSVGDVGLVQTGLGGLGLIK